MVLGKRTYNIDKDYLQFGPGKDLGNPSAIMVSELNSGTISRIPYKVLYLL